MKCPFCDHCDSYVVDSRANEEHKIIRRRRVCEACNKRFTTFEKVQFRELMVIKRSGVKKLFERQKIEKAITTALHKRNITDKQINELVSRIILEIENSNLHEISTRKIGDIIMKELAEIDQVAYIRFASVYKDFSTAHDFATFISKLKK
jgi:transcriptional repressor NrdR